MAVMYAHLVHLTKVNGSSDVKLEKLDNISVRTSVNTMIMIMSSVVCSAEQMNLIIY